MLPVHLKVCCISSIDEARIACAAGASALGLVSRMPSGPGVIDEDLIAEIVAAVPRGVATFLLTSELEAAAIVAQQRKTGASVLQLVDAVAPSVLRALRAELPQVRLVQVIHVRGPASIDEAIAVAPLVDAILLDSGNPTAAIPTLGGTGNTHDWAVSAAIVRAVSVPVFLAGGLRPENIAQAIAEVAPAGIDVCSGLRTAGRLDPEKVAAFTSRMSLRPSTLFV